MEVNGCTSGDNKLVDIFPAEGGAGSNGESDEEVSCPARTVKNTVDSDDDEPLAPTNAIAGVDNAPPQDAENSCECSPVHLLYHYFVHLLCTEVVFQSVCLCSDLSLNLVCVFSLCKLPGPLREMLCPEADMSQRTHHHLSTL